MLLLQIPWNQLRLGRIWSFVSSSSSHLPDACCWLQKNMSWSPFVLSLLQQSCCWSRRAWYVHSSSSSCAHWVYTHHDDDNVEILSLFLVLCSFLVIFCAMDSERGMVTLNNPIVFVSRVCALAVPIAQLWKKKTTPACASPPIFRLFCCCVLFVCASFVELGFIAAAASACDFSKRARGVCLLCV